MHVRGEVGRVDLELGADGALHRPAHMQPEAELHAVVGHLNRDFFFFVVKNKC